MATVNAIEKPRPKTWTVADLYRRFGPIAFDRIRQDPPPGCGTVDDVIPLNDHEDRLYELVDGILVEKTVGYEESCIAGRILTRLNIFVEPRGLGLVAGADGTIQLDFGLVRIPDVSFVSWERVPGGDFPREPVPVLVPDLAVEVISRRNTPKEMAEKLREYFGRGSAWSGTFGRGAESWTFTHHRRGLPGRRSRLSSMGETSCLVFRFMSASCSESRKRLCGTKGKRSEMARGAAVRDQRCGRWLEL